MTTCAVYRPDAVLTAWRTGGASPPSSLRGVLAQLRVRSVDTDVLRRVDPDLLSFTPCNSPANIVARWSWRGSPGNSRRPGTVSSVDGHPAPRDGPAYGACDPWGLRPAPTARDFKLGPVARPVRDRRLAGRRRRPSSGARRRTSAGRSRCRAVALVRRWSGATGCICSPPCPRGATGAAAHAPRGGVAPRVPHEYKVLAYDRRTGAWPGSGPRARRHRTKARIRTMAPGPRVPPSPTAST